MTKTPGNSIALAAVLAAAMILTGCLKSELETGLTEAESQEVIVMLKQHGLDAQRAYVARGKEPPAWTVYVLGGNNNLVLAWRVLQENGLPRQRVKGLDDVFSASGLIPTASEEKAKLLVGLTGEISRTLKSVDGVVDARVHVVLPDNSPLLDRSQWSQTTASVLIKYRGRGIPVDESEVKSLVSKGIQGLAPEQVAVVYKNVPEMPRAARDVSWYVGNQEVTAGALGVMLLAALLAFGQSIQIRRLRNQIAAMRSEYARREAVPAAQRG
jgi:type III secretion protein J